MSQKTRLRDYQAPAFLIPEVKLQFQLDETATITTTELKIVRNTHREKEKALFLNGEDLKLLSVAIDGKTLDQDQYEISAQGLTIFDIPDEFNLKTQVKINPKENLQLSGLYLSNGIFCTQCESHGFRRITYFLDRPDVLSQFTVEILSKNLPVVLANGNLIKEEILSDGSKKVIWQDPTVKPCYLFALVAGNLDCLQSDFITMSGRKVDLRIYVEKGKLDQADYAMHALKQAMKFDEETYGREYELNIYMIVAVSDFNYGAMENKGLNIFNDRYVLANKKTATDNDFINVITVVGHEYFHNWSGNRVTVSNWFQITLKEGLTVFREQTFRAAVTSAAVSRIDEVKHIRNQQFPQDSGPTAHPIQPKEYEEVNNFYTVTIYSKGAEVIRMLQTILGKEKFRKALDLYFARHDGKAVTTEDFIQAMEDESQMDLKQFRNWYHQAGTPDVIVKDYYDPDTMRYEIMFEQNCQPTPDQENKELFFIPVRLALWENGKQLKLENNHNEMVFNLTQKSQSLSFENISTKPIPSLFRGFSAPVKYDYAYTDADLLYLMQHDNDAIARWDASQTYAQRQLIDCYKNKKLWDFSNEYVKAVETLLNSNEDAGLIAELLIFPQTSYLLELLNETDILQLQQLRESAQLTLAKIFKDLLIKTYQRYQQNDYALDVKSINARRLKNLCLQYLSKTGEIQLPYAQYQSANNMTDTIAALAAMNDTDCIERSQCLDAFYQHWQADALVVDKWFALQAQSSLSTVSVIESLLKHPAYNAKNPNKVRSVVGVFANSNIKNFHAIDASGYQFLTREVLQADQFNTQLSCRLVEPLLQWRRFDKPRQMQMKNQLEIMLKTTKLSRGLSELAEQSLR